MLAQRIQDQFSARVDSFVYSANWMLDKGLLSAHLQLAGPPQPGQKCLDLCCGPGIVGQLFQDQGWEVTGIDITPGMVKAASVHFTTVQGGIESMPFEDNHFDLAVLRQSFMLVNGPAALQEIRRVLKPEGSFILSQSFAFSEEDEEQYRRVQEARHINMTCYYTPEDLRKELKDHGFTVEQTHELRVRESVDHWLQAAPELDETLRQTIRNLIATAPSGYRTVHCVEEVDGELLEDWSWQVIRAKVQK